MSAIIDSKEPTQGKRRAVKLLPPHLINRIAAGEVVERPASVVKELVENALDAGATKIEIAISAAGRTIRISDNGSGMTPEDAALAFFNHATSKIENENDLHRIQTLGFRGEALASIASISKLTCLTKTSDAATGIRIGFDPTAEDPTIPLIAPTGCAVGTVMEVAELFYNTPARLKFLKRPSTELGHIEETVETLALSHPHVRFTLINNERQTLNTNGGGDLKQTIQNVFRLDRDPIDLVEVDFEDQDAGYSVKGYASVPGVMKNSKRWLVTFTNGRTVKCHLLQKAIETAYESLLPHGRYPVCVLHLTLPSDELDVNVHPTKKEVRYANNRSIFSFVQIAIKRALEKFGQYHYTSHQFGHQPEGSIPNKENVPSFSSAIHETSPQAQPLWKQADNTSRWSYREPEPLTHQPRMSVEDALLLQAPLDATQTLSQPSNVVDTPSIKPMAEPQALPYYRVLGQLFNTYILLETAQGLMVVDQHIASERELFERISLQMLHDVPSTQHWLETTSKPVSPTQYDLLERYQGTFTKLGFSYRLGNGDSEGQTVSILGVPLIHQNRAPNQDPLGLFDDLLQQLEDTGDAQLALDQRINHLIATLSCHTAVRAGDPLNQQDMERVIEGWLASKLPWTCPHGRPIAHTIPKEELNKFFHRPSLPVNSI